MSVTTRIRSALVAAALALVSTLAVAGPAQAHDELVASTPAAGETLTSAPAAISLEFSGEVSAEGLHAQVLAGTSAADAAGDDFSGGAPSADGTIVTVPVTADIPAGSYVAIVRVVSSDGHPTEVEVPFTLDLAAPTSAPTATAEDTAVATPEASASKPATTAGDEDASGNPAGWIIGGVVVLAVLAGGGVLLARRRGTAA